MGLQVVSVPAGQSHPAESTAATFTTGAWMFGAFAFLCWLFLHLYWGIEHDATFYTMHALAHLHPELYGGDIFLRYGSQDSFTIFGPLYAFLIRLLGMDPAAAVLTLVSQAFLVLAAWKLCRNLMPRDQALLAVGLLLVLEQPYSANGIFHVVENFTSPRGVAEGLVLFGTLALVSGRNALAVVLFVATATIHPIVASAGIALFLWLRVAMVRPVAAAIAAGVVLCGVVIITHTRIGAALCFDKEWADLVFWRDPYLLLSHWELPDWSRIAPPIATLAVGALCLPSGPVRSLATGALAVAFGGLLVSAIGGDWLRIVIIVQAQPWRLLWLAVALATLLLPPLALRLWQLGSLGRGAGALLLATYLFQESPFALAVGLLAVGIAWLAIRPPAALGRREQTLILGGGAAVAIVGLLWDIASRLVFLRIPMLPLVGHPGIAALLRAAQNSSLPALILLGAWWLAFRARTLAGRTPLPIFTVLACVALLPAAVQQWTQPLFAPEDRQLFAAWRDLIPRGSEVLFAQDPMIPWVLLERPSYLSVPQIATALFSRSAARVMAQRLTQVWPFLVREGAMTSVSAAPQYTLADLCTRITAPYVMTKENLSTTALASLPPTTPLPWRGMKLYQCAHHGQPTS